MKADEVIEIVTRDPDARSDIVRVMPGATCELIDMQFDKSADCRRIRFKKKRRANG